MSATVLLIETFIRIMLFLTLSDQNIESDRSLWFMIASLNKASTPGLIQVLEVLLYHVALSSWLDEICFVIIKQFDFPLERLSS